MFLIFDNGSSTPAGYGFPSEISRLTVRSINLCIATAAWAAGQCREWRVGITGRQILRGTKGTGLTAIPSVGSTGYCICWNDRDTVSVGIEEEDEFAGTSCECVPPVAGCLLFRQHPPAARRRLSLHIMSIAINFTLPNWPAHLPTCPHTLIPS